MTFPSHITGKFGFSRESYYTFRDRAERRPIASILPTSKRIFAAVFLLTTFFVAQEGDAQRRRKTVLVPASYDHNYPGIKIFTRTVTASSKNTLSDPIEFFFEFPQSLRIPNANYKTEMVNYLQRTFETDIGLSVSTGAPQ